MQIVDDGRQQESQLMGANQMSEVFLITVIGGRIEGFLSTSDFLPLLSLNTIK